MGLAAAETVVAVQSSSEYLVQCWNCLGEYDALAAVWCGCPTPRPTKICPFCMSCFCAADPVYLENFWEQAPDDLERERAGLGRARQRLGDLLVLEGAVTEEQLAEALERKAGTGERIGEALVGIGALDQETLEAYLRRHQGSFTADLQTASIQPELIQRVGVDLCYDKLVVPLEIQALGGSRILTLAMADPSDSATVEDVGARTACRVIPEFAEKAQILDVLGNTFPRHNGAATGVRDVRKLLLEWVGKAVGRRASHIHVQCGRVDLRVFLRIDGVVYQVGRYPKKFHPYVMHEVRNLVNHPEGRPFARGQTYIRVGRRRYQLTITVQRTEHGEDVAVRVVDVESFGRDLAAEVPDAGVRAAYAAALSRPGLTVIGSPLYHGRIDTLYALIWTEHQAGRRPISLERMITCPLPGVSQTAVSPGDVPAHVAGLGGDAPLFLSDLVGTSSIQAVLDAAASRPVIATVRARGIVPFLGWLTSEVEGEVLAKVLRLLTNQRQVRLLCAECKVPDEEARPSVYLGLDRVEEGRFQPMRAPGCPACEGHGHRGRTTLYELLAVESAVAGLLLAGAPAEVLLQEGLQHGGRSLRASFLDAVRRGEIGLAEFEKVSF